MKVTKHGWCLFPNRLEKEKQKRRKEEMQNICFVNTYIKIECCAGKARASLHVIYTNVIRFARGQHRLEKNPIRREMGKCGSKKNIRITDSLANDASSLVAFQRVSFSRNVFFLPFHIDCLLDSSSSILRLRVRASRDASYCVCIYI